MVEEKQTPVGYHVLADSMLAKQIVEIQKSQRTVKWVKKSNGNQGIYHVLIMVLITHK